MRLAGQPLSFFFVDRDCCKIRGTRWPASGALQFDWLLLYNSWDELAALFRMIIIAKLMRLAQRDQGSPSEANREARLEIPGKPKKYKRFFIISKEISFLFFFGLP